MRQFIRAVLSICLAIFILTAGAADSAAVKLNYSQQRLNDKEVLLTISVVSQNDVKLYALKKTEADALYSTVSFDSSNTKYLNGAVEEKGKSKTEQDPSINASVTYFSDSVLWQQKINASPTDSLVLKGIVNYLYKEGDECKPVEESFKFYIKPEIKDADKGNNQSSIAKRSLGWIFLAAFGGGLLALLTPCVYSMIPITVSFFTKRSKDRVHGVRNSLYYSSSIIIIFTLLGFLITVIFGPAALNNMATNWIANLVFFFIFLLFGISFLGAFEITLPSSWATKADTQAGMHNFLGIFFMALTLVLISFSCTGPIIGNLLVLAAQGSYYGPLVGMFAFSLALALPFALFAFFPSLLNKLGSSGGWLNAIKVTLGFLGSIALSEEMARKNENIFLPKQFENIYNAEAHEKTTAKEIWMQLQSIDLSPDGFIAGVGTGGTIMGVGRYLKRRDAKIMVHPLEPKESPTISTGYKVGSHRIQGISDEFIPAIVELDELNEVVQSSDGDSIIMAQKLAKQLGLAVGISSGANFLGAVQVQNKLGGQAVVVTVFSDSNKKYLSTDLMKEESVKDEYFSNEVELLDYRAIGSM